MLERLSTAYFAAISLFLYLFLVSFQTEVSSKPDSNKDPLCIGPVARQIIRMESNVLPLLVWCGSLERGYQLRFCPCYLPTVQNDE
ncbi:hypothetical protein AVEN_249178-1, partial [Araneus ventricosus]